MEELREVASAPGPASVLANELLVIRDNYEQGVYTREEYDFLVSEIASVRAYQEIANDEVACRWVCAAAEAMLAII